MLLITMCLIRWLGFVGTYRLIYASGPLHILCHYGWRPFCSPFHLVNHHSSLSAQLTSHLTRDVSPVSLAGIKSPLCTHNILAHTVSKHVVNWHYFFRCLTLQLDWDLIGQKLPYSSLYTEALQCFLNEWTVFPLNFKAKAVFHFTPSPTPTMVLIH